MRSVLSPKWIAIGATVAVVAAIWYSYSQYWPLNLSTLGDASMATAKPESDSYVRNESWETGFLSSVPYRKWDVLEFAFFSEFERPYSFGFDWNSLLGRFDLISLNLDGTETDPSSLAKKTLRGGSKITVRLRAKTNGSTNADESVRPLLRELPAEPDFLPVATSTGAESKTGAVSVSPDALTLPVSEFSSDTNNAVMVAWAEKGAIRGVVIGSRTFKWADFPEGYVFVVDRGSFVDGDYFVAAYAKDGKLVPVKGKLSFRSDQQSVGVSFVTPSSVPNSRDAYVTLQGRGFSKVVSIQLSNSLVIKNASFRSVDDTVAIVKIPTWIPPGEYAMNVMDVKGISSPRRAVVRITN